MQTLLITVDSLRAGHLGQYGYERDKIPVLDRLLDSAGSRSPDDDVDKAQPEPFGYLEV